MIPVSSNLTTNILIDRVEAKKVMATLAEMGISVKLREIKGTAYAKQKSPRRGNIAELFALCMASPFCSSFARGLRGGE